MKNHRFIQQLSLEETSCDHPVQPPAQSRLSSVGFFNTSDNGDFTTSGKPDLVSDHPHSVKKRFMMFKWNLLYFNLYLLYFGISLTTPEKSLALSPLHFFIRYLHTCKIPLEPFLLQAEKSQLVQPFLSVRCSNL